MGENVDYRLSRLTRRLDVVEDLISERRDPSRVTTGHAPAAIRTSGQDAGRDHDHDHGQSRPTRRTLGPYARRHPNMAGQYWFPSMSHEEIVDSFSEWGIAINPHDLRRPSPEFVTNIYYACLQQVTTLSADGLQGPIQRELSRLDSPVCVHVAPDC